MLSGSRFVGENVEAHLRSDLFQGAQAKWVAPILGFRDRDWQRFLYAYDRFFGEPL